MGTTDLSKMEAPPLLLLPVFGTGGMPSGRVRSGRSNVGKGPPRFPVWWEERGSPRNSPQPCTCLTPLLSKYPPKGPAEWPTGVGVVDLQTSSDGKKEVEM